MQAFILVTLADKETFTFGQPILPWLKRHFPAVTVLDIDAFSDDRLVNHAVDLLQQAEKFVLCFKAETANASLGTGFRLLEVGIQRNNSGLILLQGQHQQLKAICTARPQVRFEEVVSEADLEINLRSFFS